MARPLALTAAILVSLLAVSGAGGAGAQAPKRGGTVVVGIASNLEPVCFNPALNVCWSGGNVGFLDILRGLVWAQPFEIRPGFRSQPELVSRVTVSKQPFTLTYRIRPEARWSDGVAVSARDFALTLRAIRASEPFRDDENHPFKKIVRTEVVDAKTFRMTLSTTFPVTQWKMWFSLLGPSHALVGEDLLSPSLWRDTVTNPKTGRPIGSGPFLMQSRERGRHITLVRNERYWGPHLAYLERLVFRFVPPNDLAEALRTGAIDLILPGNPPATAAAQQVRGQPVSGITVFSLPSTSWEHFDIRVGPGGHPALRSKATGKLVRRALAYGVDRAALVRALEERVFGQTRPRLSPLESVVFIPQDRFYEPNWERYRYRSAEARRLLLQAGCRPGSGGIRICDGERLSLRIGTTAGAPWRQATLEHVQRRLGEIGVEVVPQYLPHAGFVTRALREGHLDLALYAWNFLGAPTPSDVFRCGGSFNFRSYCSRLATRELVNADRVLDDEAQARALNRADRLLSRDVPVLPLYQLPGVVAFRTGIRNFDPENVLWNAEDWWLER